MNKQAFIYGFADEMEKNGIAFLAPLAAMAGRALAGKALGAVATRLAPKLLGSAAGRLGTVMSKGTQGGVLKNVLTKGLDLARGASQTADIIRARKQNQPANAGNTISTAQ